MKKVFFGAGLGLLFLATAANAGAPMSGMLFVRKSGSFFKDMIGAVQQAPSQKIVLEGFGESETKAVNEIREKIWSGMKPGDFISPDTGRESATLVKFEKRPEGNTLKLETYSGGAENSVAHGEFELQAVKGASWLKEEKVDSLKKETTFVRDVLDSKNRPVAEISEILSVSPQTEATGFKAQRLFQLKTNDINAQVLKMQNGGVMVQITDQATHQMAHDILPLNPAVDGAVIGQRLSLNGDRLTIQLLKDGQVTERTYPLVLSKEEGKEMTLHIDKSKKTERTLKGVEMKSVQWTTSTIYQEAKVSVDSGFYRGTRIQRPAARMGSTGAQ